MGFDVGERFAVRIRDTKEQMSSSSSQCLSHEASFQREEYDTANEVRNA